MVLVANISSCFKMASDRTKWRNYVYSHILGTQGVNTPPFCAGTEALAPGHQVWTAPNCFQMSTIGQVRSTSSTYLLHRKTRTRHIMLENLKQETAWPSG